MLSITQILVAEAEFRAQVGVTPNVIVLGANADIDVSPFILVKHVAPGTGSVICGMRIIQDDMMTDKLFKVGYVL
jgi:hypothetical protein